MSSWITAIFDMAPSNRGLDVMSKSRALLTGFKLKHVWTGSRRAARRRGILHHARLSHPACSVRGNCLLTTKLDYKHEVMLAEVFAEEDGGLADHVVRQARRAVNNKAPITAELISRLQLYSDDEKLHVIVYIG